jgi:hypothetical protein
LNLGVSGASPVRYARVGGVSLAYQTWGAGPATIDVRPLVPAITAPILAIHRRGDRHRRHAL